MRMHFAMTEQIIQIGDQKVEFIAGFEDVDEHERALIAALAVGHARKLSVRRQSRLLSTDQPLLLHLLVDTVISKGERRGPNSWEGDAFEVKPWRTKVRRAKIDPEELGTMLDVLGWDATLEMLNQKKTKL
jgi:hypothetical protein